MMKKALATVLVAVTLITMTAMGGFSVCAAEGSGFVEGYYTYSVQNGEATITDTDTAISGDVVIPSTLGGYPVTKIGSYGFSHCYDVTSLVIPDGVTEIAPNTFYLCEQLVDVKLPESVRRICGHAFEGCRSLKNLQLPKAMPEIGDQAFEACPLPMGIRMKLKFAPKLRE